MTLIKNLLALWKFLFVGAVWTYIYLCLTLLLFKSVWGFNYLSPTGWKVLSTFWNEGGKIRTGSDYMFVLCLILLVPLWLWGWRKLHKNFLNLLMWPVTFYQKRSADKYMKSMSRIKLHNIGVSIGDDVKKDFENRLKQQKMKIENSPRASQSIRKNLKDKLTKP